MGDYIPFRPDMQSVRPKPFASDDTNFPTGLKRLKPMPLAIVFTSFAGSKGLHKMMQIDKAGSYIAFFSFVICLMYLQKRIEIGMDLCYDLCGNIS
jgi:hypothetical protein